MTRKIIAVATVIVIAFFGCTKKVKKTDPGLEKKSGEQILLEEKILELAQAYDDYGDSEEEMSDDEYPVEDDDSESEDEESVDYENESGSEEEDDISVEESDEAEESSEDTGNPEW